MSSIPLSGVNIHVPSSPSSSAVTATAAVMSPSQVGVPGLDAIEILEFRKLLKERQEREEEAKKRASSIPSRVAALYEEHKILSIAIQFVITVGVAFVLGYYSLKGQVDDAKHQANELTSQLRTQQSEVNAVQLNVGALQGPVSNLVGLVSTLNVQALQMNITQAQAAQVQLQAGSTQLHADFATLHTQISSSQQLADLRALNNSVSALQAGLVWRTYSPVIFSDGSPRASVTADHRSTDVTLSYALSGSTCWLQGSMMWGLTTAGAGGSFIRISLPPGVQGLAGVTQSGIGSVQTIFPVSNSGGKALAGTGFIVNGDPNNIYLRTGFLGDGDAYTDQVASAGFAFMWSVQGAFQTKTS